MVKMEIEFSDSQYEKVKQLEENGISVGDAIDLLFEAKDETLSMMDELDEDIKFFEKIKDATLDVDNKAEILDDNYGDAEKTYEMKVLDVKHKVKWGRDFFKF